MRHATDATSALVAELSVGGSRPLQADVRRSPRRGAATTPAKSGRLRAGGLAVGLDF